MATKQTSQKENPDSPKKQAEDGKGLARLRDVDVTVTMRLGSTVCTLDEVTDMGEQSLIELDKQVGEPVDVLVNGKLFARGEVVTVSENFGVRLTEIIGAEQE